MIDVLKALEFDKVLSQVAEFATNDITKVEIAKIEPSADVDEVNIALDTVVEAMSRQNPTKQFEDIIDILQKLQISAVLSVKELHSIFLLLMCSNSIKKNLGVDPQYCPKLHDISTQIQDTTQLYNAIVKVIDEYGEIKDSASNTLNSIRKSIAFANQRLKDKLSSYTKNSEYSQFLQEAFVTVRNGRFVLPVKAEHRGQIEGLLHDQSASGSTVFIEPNAIVNLNNELKKLAMDEQQEIQKILKDLSNIATNYISVLDNNLRVCVFVDMIFAKSEYAKSTKSIRPTINDKGKIKLLNARHPLIDSSQVVPVDIDICDKRVLLISGPNTGGKTVTLKNLGLLSIMASSGILLPCDENSQISIFDKVFCCLGDEQSIESAFSTFSSHIIRVNEILQKATAKSLVLVDELGTGTDPEEGVAIAIAITQKFLEIGCVAAITSHYGRLKDYGVVSEQIESASMHFDAVKLKPTYKLVTGVAGASNALAVCKRLGLDNKIIECAYKYLSKESVEYNRLLLKTQETFAMAQQKFLEIQQTNEKLNLQLVELERERQKLIREQSKVVLNADRETQKLISKAKAEAYDIIEQIKEKLVEADETSLLQAKQLSKRLDKNFLQESIQPVFIPLDTKPKKGDSVLVKSIDSIGIIKELDSKGNFLVTVGVATIKCSFDNLAKSKTVKELEPKKAKIKEHNNQIKTVQTAEINLIGQTVAEALSNLEPFLQNCHISSIKDIRIVHGKGSGVLGKGVQKYLSGLKFVQSFRYGGYGEGEKGVTIVELK